MSAILDNNGNRTNWIDLSFRKFHYNYETETLIVEQENGEKQEYKPTDRDTFGNPIFSLDGDNKGHWIQFGKWKRDRGQVSEHYTISAFYKRPNYDPNPNAPLTFTCYKQEQKVEERRAIYTFDFDWQDIIYKNNENKWVYKNKNI